MKTASGYRRDAIWDRAHGGHPTSLREAYVTTMSKNVNLRQDLGDHSTVGTEEA
jgi:hypothetical protein